MFSAVDLIINLKDYPGLKEKDIVEIYHPENDYPRLLLQVTSVDAPGRTKGVLLIDFGLVVQLCLYCYLLVLLHNLMAYYF